MRAGLVLTFFMAFGSHAMAQQAAVIDPDEPQGSALNENASGLAADDQVITVTEAGNTYSVHWMVLDTDVLVQGDMDIGRFSELTLSHDAGPQAATSFGLQGLFIRDKRLWPLGIVPYEVGSGVNADLVTKAVLAWESASKIKFRQRQKGDENYAKFVHIKEDACYSTVGMQGGEQDIHLGDKCTAGNIAHEIGHTLGLGHEQMRSDRPKYVKFFEENVIKGKVGQFEPMPNVYRDSGDYCYGSIMHYGEYAFSKDEKHLKTLEAENGAEIGQRRELAPCDLAAIETAYHAEIGKRQ